MPKIKKPTRSKLVKKLDTVFSQWVRLSNADNNKNCICITCNKTLFWKEIQAGHFISRKHYSTRWDERNVKPQCAGCNVFRYGEQYKYSLFLGSVVANDLYLKSKEIVKFTNYELEDMTKDYSDKLKKLT
jgi:hypothetical protein